MTILAMGLVFGVSAQAAPKKTVTSYMSVLGEVLLAPKSPIVLLINASVKEEYKNEVSLPAQVKLVNTTTKLNGELTKVTVEYKLEPKDGGDTYFCEAYVAVDEEKETFEITGGGCEI